MDTVSERDAGIMLQILISEAKRFSKAVRKGATKRTLSKEESVAEIAADRTPMRRIETTSEDDSPASSLGYDEEDLDGDESWRLLSSQITGFWQQLKVTCPHETVDVRYHRVKCRLTTLFLWDPKCDDLRDFDLPPQHAMNRVYNAHTSRLRNLPPGDLFF